MGLVVPLCSLVYRFYSSVRLYFESSKFVLGMWLYQLQLNRSSNMKEFLFSLAPSLPI